MTELEIEQTAQRLAEKAAQARLEKRGFGMEDIQKMLPTDPMARRALIGGGIGAVGLGTAGLLANTLTARKKRPISSFLTGALLGGAGGATAGALTAPKSDAISHERAMAGLTPEQRTLAARGPEALRAEIAARSESPVRRVLGSWPGAVVEYTGNALSSTPAAAMVTGGLAAADVATTHGLAGSRVGRGMRAADAIGSGLTSGRPLPITVDKSRAQELTRALAALRDGSSPQQADKFRGLTELMSGKRQALDLTLSGSAGGNFIAPSGTGMSGLVTGATTPTTLVASEARDLAALARRRGFLSSAMGGVGSTRNVRSGLGIPRGVVYPAVWAGTNAASNYLSQIANPQPEFSAADANLARALAATQR